jgi:hypothetical protein
MDSLNKKTASDSTSFTLSSLKSISQAVLLKIKMMLLGELVLAVKHFFLFCEFSNVIIYDLPTRQPTPYDSTGACYPVSSST